MATFHENLIETFTNFKNKYITPINTSLETKIDNFTSGTYKPVTGLAYDSTKKKLGLKVDGADTVIPFSSGAKLVGTYSRDQTINVSAYGATSASQFLAVPTSNSEVSNSWGNGREGSYGMGWLYGSASYTAPIMSLSGSILSLSVARYYYAASAPSGSGSNTVLLSTKVYYVGDID